MRARVRGLAATARYRLGAARRAFLEQRPNEHAHPSYSQEGEDRILFARFGGRGEGTYVDVGAHHPHRFSNTQLFYEQGWRGVNVDPDADAMRLFDAERPEDVNLCLGVGTEAGPLRLYVFHEPALNTFDPELARERARSERLVEERTVEVRPLADILDEHLRGRRISFLNVDVEGCEADVLESNDWERYRPEIVLAESLLLVSLEAIEQDPVQHFLSGVGYVLLAKTINTLIFEAR